MTNNELPRRGRRPSAADIEAFSKLQATALERAIADTRVWRNGYAMVASGMAVVVALVGTQLADTTSWQWRAALTAGLGIGLICIGVALWLTLTIEGGKKSTMLSLTEIVEKHNSFEMYQIDQADAAYQRLATSKWWAGVGAVLCLLGLLATLWLTTPATSLPAPHVSPSSPSPTATP